MCYCILSILFAASYLTPCKRSEDIKKCFKSVIDKTTPYLVKGIPEYQIPPADPFRYIGTVVVTEKDGKHGKYTVLLSNITLTGYSGIQIEVLDIDLDALTAHTVARFPRVGLGAHMEFAGNWFDIDFMNTGYLTANIGKFLFAIAMLFYLSLLYNILHLSHHELLYKVVAK